MRLLAKFGKLSQPIFWLHCLHFTMKLNALLGFNLYMRKPYATASRLWNIYSFLFTIFISLEYYISITFHLNKFFPKDVTIASPTIYIVLVILIVLSAEKANFIYMLQYWNNHKLMRLINEGFELYKHLIVICKDAAIGLPVNAKNILSVKVTVTLLQFAILQALIFSIQYVSFNILILFNSHWIGIMMSSTIFCGLFIVRHFYWMLNMNLRRCMSELKMVTTSKACHMRMQRFCDLSDDIDRLACLYARCLVFTEQMNKYFSVTIFMTIGYAFALILSQLFFIYSTISRIMTANIVDSSDNYLYVGSCGSIILFYSVDIYFIVSVSNDISKAGRKPGLMLYSLGEDIDDRLHRSVSHDDITIVTKWSYLFIHFIHFSLKYKNSFRI